jgi:hypothetical protein
VVLLDGLKSMQAPRKSERLNASMKNPHSSSKILGSTRTTPFTDMALNFNGKSLLPGL